MYENQTFQAIMNRCLDRLPGSLDKREGSVIYDALAPAAMELALAYVELDVNMRLSFADTSSGSYLERRTSEFGIERQLATKARRKGLFYGNLNAPLDVPIGSRFSMNGMKYMVVERISAGVYKLDSEVAGVKGNHNFGTLLPIDYIPGLVGAELSDVLVPGEDAESDEELRQRYKLKTTRPATSGNKYHYEQWAAEVPGVGAAKIFPLWHGAGTVKVVIVDATNSPASPTLIQDVQAYISPSAGMGGGKAPIGAQVTVASAIGKAIHISATITLASGYSLQQVNDHFISAVRDYFREIGFTTSYLSIAKIGTILLDTLGILDYSALKLNSGMVNVAIAEEEIPTLGTVSLVV